MNASFESARRQMIDQQVRSSEVLDPRVLDVLAAVPRERFVPPAYRGVAFADTAIPLGHGQHMLTPRLEGRILQALAPGRGERTLEVGTGSGFFAACLAGLAGSADTLEIQPALAAAARQNLGEAGVTGVRSEVADAMTWRAEGAYRVIALTGSLPVPDPRFERLLEVGGRLFVVVGSGPIMEARLVTRTAEDAWLTESLFETCIDPLLNAAPAPRFRF